MKYLIILEVVKNRRVFAFCLDLSRKLFGGEMMLLPRMSTTLCSMRFLKCDVGVCDELLEFFLCRKAFLLTYLSFLRMDILGIRLPRLNNIADIVSCESFSESHATRNSLLHKFSSRPFHSECCPRWVFFQNSFRIYKFLNLFCNSLHVLLVLVNFVVRDAVVLKINRLFEFFLRPSATL